MYSIGIDEYKHMNRLRCCKADAESLAGLFRRRDGTCEVHEWCDEKSQGPVTLGSLLSLLTEIAQAGLELQDRIALYFAGHGYAIAGTDYLACCDTKPDDDATALRVSDIVQALTSSGAGTAYLILDACRTQPTRSPDRFGDQTLELARRQGVVTFFGCSPGQVCQELHEDLGHGVFTSSVVRAVEDYDATTPVSLDERVIQLVAETCHQHRLLSQVPYTAVAPLQKARLDIFTGELRTGPSGRRKCILVLGPSNAGKTRLGQCISTTHGFTHVEMSSFAWARFASRQPEFDGSLQDFLETVVWRGDNYDQLARDLTSQGGTLSRMVVCGARRPEEVEHLEAQDWDILKIFLYANSKARYGRFLASGTADQTTDYKKFVLKDFREYSWGLAKLPEMRNVALVVNEQDWPTFLRSVSETHLSPQSLLLKRDRPI